MRHGPMKWHTMYVMILSRSLAMPNFVFVDTDALDTADPNSMQDACHVSHEPNIWPRALCSSVEEQPTEQSEDLIVNICPFWTYLLLLFCFCFVLFFFFFNETEVG